MRRLILIFTALLPLLVGFLANGKEGYNEIFDKNGKVRPAYRAIYPLWLARYSTKTKQTAYLRWSRGEFNNDNALDSMARIILADDYDETLKSGVEQRARAIEAFLKDHYSGKKSYSTAGILPEKIVDRIVTRNGDAGYRGRIDATKIAFMYGPDIIKDEDGHWRVIEDNVGYIGGIGDLQLAQGITLETYPSLKKHGKFRSANRFYIRLASHFKKLAAEQGGIAVMYTIPSYSSDSEDRRITKIMSRLGVQLITPYSKNQFEIRGNGVYLVETDEENSHPPKAQKIGFMFLNDEHAWIDPDHPAARARNLIDEASVALSNEKLPRKTRDQIRAALADINPKTHQPNLRKLDRLVGEQMEDWEIEGVTAKNRGLLDAILKGKIDTNYTPGIDFIGDKEFYVYVENLIEFYLNEKPIIHNIPTEKFASVDGSLNEKVYSSVFAHLENFVVKKVDGRGGSTVWVGPKMDLDELPNLKKAIRENPDFYIAQKFTPLSTLNDNIVDLRVITSVTPAGIIVTDTPWGRGLPKGGNGKVNLSDKGREVTVLVMQPKAKALSCKAIVDEAPVGTD